MVPGDAAVGGRTGRRAGRALREPAVAATARQRDLGAALSQAIAINPAATAATRTIGRGTEVAATAIVQWIELHRRHARVSAAPSWRNQFAPAASRSRSVSEIRRADRRRRGAERALRVVETPALDRRRAGERHPEGEADPRRPLRRRPRDDQARSPATSTPHSGGISSAARCPRGSRTSTRRRAADRLRACWRGAGRRAGRSDAP